MSRFTLPFESVFDTNGNPGSGWKLAFYVSGTSTPQATYSNAALSTPNSNPVISNSSGRFSDIFLSPSVSYKVTLSNASNVVQWTADPVSGAGVVAGDLAGLVNAAAISNTVADQQAITDKLDILQSGAGAVTRSLGDELREHLSVKQFGALGDDSNDDTAEVQAALTRAATTGQAVFFPAGTYKIASTLTAPVVRLYGEGMGRTVLKFYSMTGSTDGISFSNPSGYDQLGCVEEMTIQLSGSSGRYGIVTPRGNFADVGEYRPKWRFSGLSFRSSNTVSTTDSYAQDYGWTFCIRLADSWNAEISFIDATGTYQTANDPAGQTLDGFLQLNSQNGILSCRIHHVTTHNIANFCEVVEKAYFHMHNVDVARAYRGIYDGSGRVYEANVYAYGECNIQATIINAQLRGIDLDQRFATTISNCAVHRVAGYDHASQWKGILLRRSNGCAVNNCEISVGAGFTDDMAGIELDGGLSNCISNVVIGGGLTASIRLADDVSSNACQATQISNVTANGNTALLFDLREARGTNIVNVSKSSGYTVTSYITYGNDSTRNTTQFFGIAGDFQLLDTQPKLMLVDTDGTATNKRWRVVADGGTFAIATETDSGVFSTNALVITRSGTALTTIALRAATTISGSEATLSGATYARLMLEDLDGASSEKRWRINADGTTFALATENDAGAFGANALLVTRSGTTPLAFDFRAPLKLNNGPTISSGSGTPEAAVTAPVGSLFLRTNGGASTSLYVKESGSGNTGWRAV